MIKRIIESAPRWTIAGLLFFTQLQAEADLSNPCYFSLCDTSECCDAFQVDIDYLYWKIQNSPEAVPLVIQGPTLAVPSPVLGAPDTSVVLGGKKIDTGWRSGGRITLGYELDQVHCSGVEVNYFLLPNESKKYSVSSDGSPNSPFLLVPFFNVDIGAEDSTAIASPLLQFEGTATLKLINKMQGAEFNVSTSLSSSSESQFFGLAGFRFWNFKEDLTFTTNSPYIPPHVVDTYKTKDEFNVRNNFYGCQLGLLWEYDGGCLSLSAKGKFALGAMCESLKIKGHLLTNDYDGFGAVQEFQGGYFALPANSGKHHRIKLTAIPECNFDIGYRLLDGMQVKLGYTFMCVSNVLWAGNQIDRTIDPSQATTYTNALPPVAEGAVSPKAHMKNKSLWAQGLKVGVEFRF